MEQDPNTSAGEELYLIEMDQNREKEAVKAAFALYYVLPQLLSDLGFNSVHWWLILEMPIPPAIAGETNSTGEIDALIGPLVVGNEGIDWPPKAGFLAAIEAKATYVYFKENGTMAVSTTRRWHGDRRKAIKAQLPRMIEIGFNRIALLDIVATPPSSSDLSGQAWLKAAEIGSEAIEALARKLDALELQAYPFVGHSILGWGSVAGGNEMRRGAPGLSVRLPSLENPFLKQPAVEIRKSAMWRRATELLSRLPPPGNSNSNFLPLMTRFCQHCKLLHRFDLSGEEDLCHR
jgi:hypothetical protein